jgi:DNA-binding NarL/FixJ family response regulator
VPASIELARAAFDRRSWREAYELLGAVEPLGLADLERLAIAAHLVGRDDDSATAWERAHLACLDAGDRERAARCAFWLSLALVLRGETARGTGWLARAERLVEGTGASCAARGFLLVVDFLQAIDDGDATTAYELAGRVVDIAHRCGDRDLLAFGLLGRGQASLALGEVARGLKLLDEVMVSVTADEVMPICAGITYCAVIEACVDAFDLRRAAEWTAALHDWCAAEPDLVPYRGQCLVHRSQVLQVHGDWAQAVAEAEQASTRLANPLHPALGTARYQQGELHRLRGELAEAAAAYRDAAELGRDPAPGSALLRLAAGDAGAARLAIRRMLAEATDLTRRPAVLAAAVEIHLSTGDVAAARAASDELADLAIVVDAPMLHAIADAAVGAVLVAGGAPGAALVALRRALTTWRALAAPYEMARVRAGIAMACRALGDEDAAELELDAARSTFERLGATSDLRGLDSLQAQPTPPPGHLTERELEVLRLVATGQTNQQIASELVISTHTVARHLQNIYVKLHLSSRAAATAYAYEHDLVR